MIRIEYKINGKKIRPEHFGNEIEKAVLAQASDEIKKRLNSVICREHNERPAVKVIGKSVSELSFEIKGCCQQLIDDATSKLE